MTTTRRRTGRAALLRLALPVLGIVAIAGCAVTPSPSVPASARPTPSPTPVVTPTAPPTSKPSPTAATSPTGEVRWDRIGSLGDEYDLQDAVGFEDGYVAIYGGGVRFSSDGVAWRPVKLPHGKGVAYPRAVDTDGERVVVVGLTSPCANGGWPGEFEEPVPARCVWRPASWVSEDGRTWRMSRRWTGPISTEEKAGSAFVGVWAVPTGGWDAAQAFWGGDMSDDPYLEGSALWHSGDGRSWSLLRNLPAETVWICYGEYPWVVAGPDGRRVTPEGGCQEEEPGTSLSSSIDGREYQPLGAAPLEPGDFIFGALAPPGPEPWVFVGGRCVGTCVPVGWSTRDLDTWIESPMQRPTGNTVMPRTVARHGAGYVATGGGLTWLSDDGTTWRLADVASADVSSINEIAIGPAGVIGFGLVTVTDVASDDLGSDRIDVFSLSDVP